MERTGAVESLESELARARELDTARLADAIETVGFECTHCGACCRAETGCGGAGDEDGDEAESDDARSADAEREPHTATVFPEEVRELQAAAADAGERPYDWRDVARPMPYGLDDGPDGPTGETFEWALAIDDCGDCAFYEERDGDGACTVHDDRPLVCRTYPFSVALGGTSRPQGEVVDGDGLVRAHECEGLGRDIDREDAEALAAALKARAVRELSEAVDVREAYEPVAVEDEVVVHDSEGAKRGDGTPLGE